MKSFKTIVGMSALVCAVSGCASESSARAGKASAHESAVGATRIAPGVVDGNTAHELVAGGIRVVDVRTAAEFQSGHVPGALNIPYDEMPHRYDELGPPSTPILVYCRSGARSLLAIATLREKGFTQIYDLKAYDRWVAAEAGSGAR